MPLWRTIAEVLSLDLSSPRTARRSRATSPTSGDYLVPCPATTPTNRVSLTRGPSVTTDATSSSSAGTYYVRPSGAQSKKYSFTYVDGDLVLSSLTAQEIAWGQSFSGVGVGQTVDLNASASSNLGRALLRG